MCSVKSGSEEEPLLLKEGHSSGFFCKVGPLHASLFREHILMHTSDISQLVPVLSNEIGAETVQTVNARDLHAWLGSGQKFSDWIKHRIEQYEFTQAVDFVVIPNFETDETAFGGKRKTIEYFISLDMAKELSMVERNAKGKEARQYFIQCEKIAKQELIPQDYATALRAAADAWEAKQRAEAQVKALEQDNQLLNTIIDNEFGYCSILRAAKHLGVSETEFNWRPLKKWTIDSGLEVKRVPSPRFDYMNLYPIAAFEACYPQYDFSELVPESVAERSVKLLGGQVHLVTH